MLVYAVERNSGTPRPGVNVLVVKNKNDVTKGTTDKQGLLKLKVVDKRKPAASEEEEESDEEAAEEEPAADNPYADAYLVMASEGDNFAISDLQSYYFGGYGEYEGEEGGGESLTSYIYTER